MPTIELDQLFLMVTDSAWDIDYRVYAKTPLKAAQRLADYTGKPLDEIKKLYRPIRLADVVTLN